MHFVALLWQLELQQSYLWAAQKRIESSRRETGSGKHSLSILAHIPARMIRRLRA